jgi:hypothetical protein
MARDPHPAVRDERTVNDLQDERDRALGEGRLRLGAELTTWIDELIAETSRMGLTTVTAA